MNTHREPLPITNYLRALDPAVTGAVGFPFLTSPLRSPSGLIIDAFGELRDQQEQVKEDMEVRHSRKGV